MVFEEFPQRTQTIADITVGKTDIFRSLVALPPFLQHLVGLAEDFGCTPGIEHPVGWDRGYGNLSDRRNLCARLSHAFRHDGCA